MASTDRLCFSKEKIFQTISNSLKKTECKLKNILDCKDDVLFIWNAAESRILVQYVKNRNDSFYQELFPNEPPLFQVDSICVNSVVTKAVLWGSSGVAVVDVPRRWGAKGAFQGGDPVILVSCSTVEDRNLSVGNTEVRQVRFHPGSERDHHLAVLTTDNCLRVYLLTSTGGGGRGIILHRTWVLGVHPQHLTGGRLPPLVMLGDTAVDFDFAPPVVDEEKAELKFPCVILRGNGDVVTLTASLSAADQPPLVGPLTMYPSADDNYGVDACSILALQTVPPLLVVATCAGTIHHCVMLQADQDQADPGGGQSHALYVVESVELELGLQLTEEGPEGGAEGVSTCPVLLHRDPHTTTKYYCTHSSGVHAVSVTCAAALENYLDQAMADELHLEGCSTVEYLVCTRTNLTPACPVLGLTLLSSARALLGLLHRGGVISLPLRLTDAAPVVGTALDEDDGLDEFSPIKKLLRQPFDVHVRNLLKRQVNQPILSLDKTREVSPQECMELLGRATALLRQEYFTKLETVREEMERRIATLVALRKLQLEGLVALEGQKAALQDTAEGLAEKYEDVLDRQTELSWRVSALVSTIVRLHPTETIAEKKMRNELVTLQDQMDTYDKSISKLRDKMDYQSFKIEERRGLKKDIQLADNQISTIRTGLEQSTQDIADLVTQVKLLKTQLNITDD